MKRVLVTGGTGSIGSRVVRKFFDENYEVEVLDVDETKLYFTLRDEYDYKVRTHVVDVRDPVAIQEVMDRGFDIVVHAAAYKHVPTGEYFPDQMVGVNVQGALNVFRAAVKAGVKRVVVVSTDKAAYPTGVMGASKLIQERMALNMEGKTSFNVVRFGNVVMSRGGVVERFAELVSRKRKLQVMDERMTRFWMDYDDAVELVWHAAQDKDTGCVYSMITRGWKVTDLAKAYGVKDWEVLGRRKGEKIHEVLITEEECERAEVSGKVVKVYPDVKKGKRPNDLKALVKSDKDLLSVDEIRSKLKEAELL